MLYPTGIRCRAIRKEGMFPYELQVLLVKPQFRGLFRPGGCTRKNLEEYNVKARGLRVPDRSFGHNPTRSSQDRHSPNAG
jgi:hypothetical protein